ncbi:unnamed protein product [Tenebrio molitor]|nr:unnamed protein product [Tenebrio molitor]
MGATLHYSMLSQFCWMLVACLFAWGLPLLPVMSVLISDDNSYASGKVGLCYPSGYGLYLGVWLPVSLIVCVNLSCDATQITSNGVKWPRTSNRTLSEPPCVNQAKEFLYRECSNGQWCSEPVCFAIQADPLPQCPDGFIEKGDICYTFSPKSTFPPTCPFQDVLPFNVYSGIIGDDIVEPVWMPVTRDLSNGFGFFQWTEASELYKSTYNYGSLTYDKSIRDKNCVLYCKECTKIAVPCNEEHPAVCAYNKLSMVTNALCDSLGVCHQSDFDSRSTCFCLVQDSNGKAEFLKPYQNYVYDVLTSDTCGIGLQKTINGSYIWETSKQEISYTFWSKEVVFDSTHVYGASSPDGWVLTENPGSCFVVEQELAEVEPKLKLDLDQSNNYFVLEVTNPMWIKMFQLNVSLFCFTDAHPKMLVQSIPITDILEEDDDVISYKFAPVASGPGHYWCEAFDFVSLEVIKSEVFFLRDVNVFEFVALFKVKYSSTIDPIDTVVIKYLESTLLTRLLTVSYLQTYYTPRIMKIEDFDEKNLWIWVNIHFSANPDVDISNEESKEYDDIRNLIDDDLSTIEDQIQIVDFFHMDYCNAESGQLTWPKTSLGSVAFPEQYCFRADGSRVMRLCDGDFIDGARWSQFDDCEVFKGSSVTQRLELTLLNIPRNQSAEWINRILRNYTYFQPLDVYFVATAYSHYLTPPNVSVFTETFENFLKINKSVLAESQLKLRTTDKFLYFIDNILINSDEIVEVVEDDFALFLSESKNLSGIAVLRIEDKFEVVKLRGNKTVDDIMAIENLDSAIWLNPELSQYWYDDEKLTISLFFNDALFQQARSVRTDSVIFGVSVSLPGFARLFEGPVQILQRVDNLDDRRQSCAYWRYGSGVQGAWREERKVRRYSSFSLCEFWRVSHFAMVLAPKLSDDGNVTDDLIDVLNSNDSTPNTIAKLYNISERYDAFRPVDVSYTEQILQKVSEDEEIDLQVLAYIVSNLHQIKRSVLLKSQTEVRATDMVLSYVDMIIKKHRYDSRVATIADNFMVFTIDPNESNFTGLAVHNHKHTFDVQILEGNVTIDDVSSLDSFDSAVVFSDDLKRQLVNGSKVIVTVFANDALFNEEDSPSKLVSKVFGVILPEIGEFQGPISVLHKTKYGDQCVHWFYNQVRGFWKEDSTSKNASHLAQCDYWHTTHFALLLLAKDDFSNESYIATDIGVFYVSGRINRVSEDYLLCTVVGVILHYSIISQFCWMLIIAVLQFRRFVTVLGGPPRYVLFKSCICGWVLPLFPVVSVLVFDRSNYVSSKVGLCYPSGWGLYLGVWLPIAFIIVVNCIIFINILHNVIHKKTEHSDVPNNEVMYQWRLAVLLFFMFGLTWVFGFVSNFEVGVVFVYLFCFTATLQGFIIFLFFIVCNSNTRYLYTRLIKKHCNKCKQ